MGYTYTVKKGDNLNSISKQFGFKSYKDAGISSVPSGNFDMIREGDQVVLNNYDPTKLSSIVETTPTISSNDRTREYERLSKMIDDKAGTKEEPKTDQAGNVIVGTLGGKNVIQGQQDKQQEEPVDEKTGDTIYDEYTKSFKDAETSSKKWADDQRRQVQNLLPQTLRGIDATYDATMQNITSTYENLIDEQIRFNRVNTDRTKAYGVGMAKYVPLEYTKAVSNIEAQGAREIGKLNNERNSLIAQAKALREQGRVGAMRTTMEDLNKIEEQMQKRTTELFNQVQTRLEIQTKAREEAEAKHLEEVQNMVAEAILTNYDKFDKAKDGDEQAKIIREIISKSGGKLTDKDFSSVYTALSDEQGARTKAQQEADKAELERRDKESSIAKRQSDTALAWKKEQRLSEEDKDDPFVTMEDVLGQTDDNGALLFVDESGTFTVDGFKKVLKEARVDGISRKEFLEEYAWRLDESKLKEYGLTPEEINKIQNL